MTDYMVRAVAAKGQVRAFAITSRELTERARSCHNTSPVVTAALGRLLSGGAMMGAMMKGEQDILTIQVRGSGPMRGLTVTADSKGSVKGYPLVPDVLIPANDKGKLDVAGALGPGYLNVIKDLGLKEPYGGQTELSTSEIAEDLAYYFAVSEQVPSAVGLGVLMEKNNTVKQAGGFIIQLMPFAEEEVISRLEQKVASVDSVTSLLEQGHTPETLLQLLLGESGLEITDRMPVRFFCNCSKERVTKALISVGEQEIQKMVQEGKPIEVNCHFCNTTYTFTPEELKEIIT
ncbi:MAG: Hsp33 family molecular chaperone HslO [Lachnospiraceae bacterium]|nr:Hsp33 family molecular chaperone HslO [Lachnospiraceae bacterium]